MPTLKRILMTTCVIAGAFALLSRYGYADPIQNDNNTSGDPAWNSYSFSTPASAMNGKKASQAVINNLAKNYNSPQLIAAFTDKDGKIDYAGLAKAVQGTGDVMSLVVLFNQQGLDTGQVLNNITDQSYLDSYAKYLTNTTVVNSEAYYANDGTVYNSGDIYYPGLTQTVQSLGNTQAETRLTIAIMNSGKVNCSETISRITDTNLISSLQTARDGGVSNISEDAGAAILVNQYTDKSGAIDYAGIVKVAQASGDAKLGEALLLGEHKNGSLLVDAGSLISNMTDTKFLASVKDAGYKDNPFFGATIQEECEDQISRINLKQARIDALGAELQKLETTLGSITDPTQKAAFMDQMAKQYNAKQTDKGVSVTVDGFVFEMQSGGVSFAFGSKVANQVGSDDIEVKVCDNPATTKLSDKQKANEFDSLVAAMQAALTKKLADVKASTIASQQCQNIVDRNSTESLLTAELGSLFTVDNSNSGSSGVDQKKLNNAAGSLNQFSTRYSLLLTYLNHSPSEAASTVQNVLNLFKSPNGTINYAGLARYLKSDPDVALAMLFVAKADASVMKAFNDMAAKGFVNSKVYAEISGLLTTSQRLFK